MWNKVSFLISIILVLLSLLGCFAGYCETPVPTTSPSPLAPLENCGSALLYNVENDTVMYSKNKDEKLLPSTTAKMMTAIVALSFLKDRMEEEVTIPSVVMQNAVGSHMELKTGEVIAIKELFHGLIMANANDAAYMLALVCSGSVEEFVKVMNRTAKEYGMVDTNYLNPTGIDEEGSFTTAQDVLTLSLVADNNSLYKEISQKTKYTVAATNKKGKRELHTRNYMLSKLIYPNYYYSQADGLLAGSTEKGGYCISATAEIDNMNYVAVVMNATGSIAEGFGSFICARALFDWGPSRYSYRTIVNKGDIVGEIKVDLAEEYDYVAVTVKESLTRYLPVDMDIEKRVTYEITLHDKMLTAPVEDKQVVGNITVLIDGDPVGVIDLITLRGLTLSRKESTIRSIQLFLTNKTVVTVFITMGCVFVLGVLIYARYLYLKKRKIRVKAHTEND